LPHIFDFRANLSAPIFYRHGRPTDAKEKTDAEGGWSMMSAPNAFDALSRIPADGRRLVSQTIRMMTS